ncbi:MAG: HAD-IIIC family phosphatase [Oscillospiraceae bacterium]|nr:HAD-IIIC family phosphatase [Oscillospiraceae bacterium]
MEKVSYNDLRKMAKSTAEGKKKIAIIGDCATQQLATAIRGESIRRDYPLTVMDCDYDQMEAQLLDADSKVYEFQPDYILLFASAEKLKKRFYDQPVEVRAAFAEQECQRFQMLWQSVSQYSKAKILMFDFPEEEDAVFGSYALRTKVSFAYQTRRLNMLMSESAADAYPNVYPLALSALQAMMSRSAFFENRTWYLAKMAVSTNALPAVASRVLDTITALGGKTKKCVILDLDNTLWGGVIGDDGIDGIQLGELGDGPAFTALQRWLLELKNRGILLAVCSKNNEDTAKEPFEKHPEMVLRLSDIAAFIANWENKAQNISQIQQTLNIGMDSLVFLDDNPFERNLVREMLPEVTVPELPEDPSAVPAYLESLHLFEAVSYSQEDTVRTSQYQAEASRKSAMSSFTSYDDYLNALHMEGRIQPFDSFHFPRIAQLTQRSNQFNLRTIRYSESDVAAMAENPDYYTRYMTLADKYGEHGLISVVICKKQSEDTLFIDTWLMSCRVLRRGVEGCLFDAVVQMTLDAGFRYLSAEYIPTAKNAMVQNFYEEIGMKKVDDSHYILDCREHAVHSHYITVV